MKTTTMELTPAALAAFVNLVDIGMKNERLGGIQVEEPASLVVPLLKQAQLALHEQENGADIGQDNSGGVVSSPFPEPDNQDAIGGTDG